LLDITSCLLKGRRFFCVNSPVTNRLRAIVKDLQKKAESHNFKLSTQEIKSDGIIIVANIMKKKACFISVDKEDGALFGYVIHIKKFLWAEEEGFTRGDMVAKLGDEVFESIPINKMIDHLK